MLDPVFVKQAAARAGFDLCGISRSRNLDAELELFGRWLDEGMDGGLEYMRRNIDKRFSPGRLMEGARSVIACGVSYRNEFGAGYPEGYDDPKISSYALSSDYHETVKGMLREIVSELLAEYGEFRYRVFCDTAPVLEKRWAVEAGLGWQGRNSLLVNPSLGSFIFLGEIVTDMEAKDYDLPHENPGCGACTRCEQACPAGALAGGVLDARKCISRITIEKSSGLAGTTAGEGSENRPTLDGWVFGCDICQSVCPYNLSAPAYRNRAFGPLLDPHSLTREYWMSLTEEEFMEKFRGTPIYRTGLERLRRNIKE